MSEPTPSESGGSDAERRGATIPARIGRYAIVRVLGEGGMGTVYEAQQDNPKRAVALKVVRAGFLTPELLRRFTQESQVLGRLQHAGIAQIYEAGLAQDERGQDVPFFAMEFVNGMPLNEHVRRKNLGTRARLELIAKVSDAVYHAHQKGVIHRDLKPGNILVDEAGEPKVLDFGVARATDGDIQQTTLHTDVGQLIGTIPYMSPEQVGGDPGDLDTRSDVYALGVVTYELLAGRLPYDLGKKMIPEAARIIREEEPTRLSSFDRALRGDVETIVAKALEKDKLRRYQSAESFASDIRRYLRDEPIAARPASTWYQLQKFGRRNRGLVTGIVASFAVLVAGIIGTSLALRRALRAESDLSSQLAETDKARKAEADERAIAVAQRDKAELVADFMSETLGGAGPMIAAGRDSTMLKEMMDRAAERIDKGELSNAPEAELRLRGEIGETYCDLALYPEAAKMLDSTLTLAQSLHADDHSATADALTWQGRLRRAQGEPTEAESLMREAFEMRRRLTTGDSVGVATGMVEMGSLLSERGKAAEAEPLYRQAVDMLRRLHTGDEESLANAIGGLGTMLWVYDRFDEAEPHLRESLEMIRRIHPGAHPAVASAMNNLGLLQMSRGRLAEAEGLFAQALEMRRTIYPADSPELAFSLVRLGQVQDLVGKGAEALPHLQEALEMQKRLHPGDHLEVSFALTQLGVHHYEHGDMEKAAQLFREALEIDQRLMPGDHPHTVSAMINLGGVLYAKQDLDGAVEVFREALEMGGRIYPGDNTSMANARNALSAALFSKGEIAEAEPLIREAVGMFERTVGKDSWDTGNARVRLARTLMRLDRFAEAEVELAEIERVMSVAEGVPADAPLKAARLKATLYESWDEAEPGQGHDVQRAEWQERVDALMQPQPPASVPSGAASQPR